ncbi:hypothetical protein F2P79_008005 [Pimephales promelas]|nr:hypothetical protein F2P79_008005 [Pimephales promelas]
MNACGHLSILCILLFDLQPAFCNEFAKRDVPNGHDEISGGDFFKSWLNSKQRRSVKSVGDRGLKALKQTRQIKPQFECGDLVFKVFLKQDDVVNLRISGPRGDLLRLEQLSAFCGVAIKTSHTDVHLLFSYDSCYVKPEESGYVLSLSWYGTEQALSCPRSRTPPSVVCKNNAMEMTLAGDGRADELSVALNGEWAPLLYVAAECWHRERSYQGQLTFSVPYSSCGVYFRDGHFILVLKSKGQMIPLSSQYFQPAEPHLNFYRGSYGPLGSTSTRQSPERLYPSSPALQEDGPSSPKRVQKPGQQPWSTSHRPVKKPSQEPKPLVPASRRTPDVLEYLTGGDESLELYQRSFEDASGIEIPSHSQYRPTLLSADVSTRKTGSRHMGFFQPRSIAPVPSPQAPTFTGNRPIMSLPQPMPRFFSVKEGAPVAQLPYSQGPSVRGMQLAPVYSEKPSEASSQKPQNATLPPHQFFRPASLEKDIFGSPLFRSTSQEVQPPKDASHSYFYSPSAAEALN